MYLLSEKYKRWNRKRDLFHMKLIENVRFNQFFNLIYITQWHWSCYISWNRDIGCIRWKPFWQKFPVFTATPAWIIGIRPSSIQLSTFRCQNLIVYVSAETLSLSFQLPEKKRNEVNKRKFMKRYRVSVHLHKGWDRIEILLNIDTIEHNKLWRDILNEDIR